MLAERQLRHDKTIGIEQGIEEKESKKAKEVGENLTTTKRHFA